MSGVLVPNWTAPVDLSLVVNLAHGGRLAHPTFRSLDAAVHRAVEDGWTVEVVLVVDGEAPDTDEYLAEHLHEFFDGVEVRRINVMNRDLGLSRNSGAAEARGAFVAFSDADNLYSANWLSDALGRLSAGDADEIAHPAFVVTFEARDALSRLHSSTDEAFDRHVLAEHNFWDAACVAPRRAVLEVPYAPSLQSPGFGPEDWHWNIETLDRGWQHVVVPRTVMYYRVRHRGSLSALFDGRSVLLAPSQFLTRPRAALRVPPPGSVRRGAGAGAMGAIRTVGRAGVLSLRWVGRIHPRIQRFGSQLRPAVSELFGPSKHTRESIEEALAQRQREDFPDWLRDDWRAAHELEPALFPSEKRLATMGRWIPSGGLFASIYWDLVEKMDFDGQGPEYVFIVPWMIPGGASAVVANYLHAVSDADPQARIVVLVTAPREPAWVPDLKLPGNVRIVEIPPTFGSLVGELQERLLSTLLVQFGPRVVHLINSNVGFRSYARHPRQLHSRSKLFLSLFTIDETVEGESVHPVFSSIRDYVDELDGIFVDNEVLRNRLVTLFGLPTDAFFVHFQPTATLAVTGRTSTGRRQPGKRLSVLWTGRLDRQKRPDILVEIAQLSVERGLPIDYFVSSVSVLDPELNQVAALEEAGVAVLGPYQESVASLGRPFDVLLNTSQWEGLPLALIDAARQDITILAAPSGGVVDFVRDRETGFLVERFDDAEAYVATLALLAANRRLLQSTRAAARALADTRHNWSMFMATLRGSAGYLG